MHGAKHARNELVYTVALMHKWYKGGYTAFVVADITEMGEYEFLELFDLVLQHHEICDSLVAFVRVVDRFETDVFLILESPVELWMLVVEGKLSQQVVDVFTNQRRVSAHALASQTTVEAFQPSALCHGFFDGGGMAFLDDLVYRDQGFERLYFVGENRLAVAR